MDPGEAVTEAPDTPADPPQVPFLFGIALWVPTFAVVLWVMLRLMGPRAVVPTPDGPEDDEGEDDDRASYG